jgi:hypothetical protein
MKHRVSFITCSFSKILVWVAGLTAILILLKSLLRLEGPSPAAEIHAHQRGLKNAAQQQDEAPFIDILRDKPKVGSYSWYPDDASLNKASPDDAYPNEASPDEASPGHSLPRMKCPLDEANPCGRTIRFRFFTNFVTKVGTFRREDVSP